MEEKIVKQVKAQYFKSATKVLLGDLTLTNQRITYSGIEQRIKQNHGVVGNVIRDKMEKAMGYDDLQEEHIFDIPLSEAESYLKRFGLSKRLVIADKSGTEFKLILEAKKAERDEWPNTIENTKKSL